MARTHAVNALGQIVAQDDQGSWRIYVPATDKFGRFAKGPVATPTPAVTPTPIPTHVAPQPAPAPTPAPAAPPAPPTPPTGGPAPAAPAAPPTPAGPAAARRVAPRAAWWVKAILWAFGIGIILLVGWLLWPTVSKMIITAPPPAPITAPETPDEEVPTCTIPGTVYAEEVSGCVHPLN